jgi:hypothetical protein
VNALQIDPPLTPRPERAEAQLALAPALPPAERARRLMADARAASSEHLDALQAAIGTVIALSQEVVAGGGLYDAGLNDFARRMAEDLLWRAKTLEALSVRQRLAARSS